MSRTRKSLYYLASYLLFGGMGLLFMPSLMLRVFMATGDYEDVMVRLVGLMMLSLGIFVVQVIRQQLEQLYPTTLIIRSVILCTLAAFYLVYHDTLFLVLIAIVGVGFVLTALSLIMDRKKQT